MTTTTEPTVHTASSRRPLPPGIVRALLWELCWRLGSATLLIFSVVMVLALGMSGCTAEDPVAAHRPEPQIILVPAPSCGPEQPVNLTLQVVIEGHRPVSGPLPSPGPGIAAPPEEGSRTSVMHADLQSL